MVSIEKQTMKSKMELEAWRKEAKKLEEMLKKPNNSNTEVINDILSDINSRKSAYEDVSRFIYLRMKTIPSILELLQRQIMILEI